MTMDEIMNAIKSLANSQGSYGRLYAQLESIRQYDNETWQAISADFENMHFNDVVDLIMFIEG